MKKTFNRSTVIGHAASSAEYRVFPNGGAVANLVVYTDEGYRDRTSGNWIDISEKHVVVFKNKGNYKLADLARDQIEKGALVFVEGPSLTRHWQEGSIRRFIKEISVEEFRVVQPPTPTPLRLPGQKDETDA